MYELIPLLNEFSMMSGCGPIDPRDAQYMMYMFDADGSGAINFMELRMILKMMGGIKHYDRNTIMSKKKNKKNKKKKGKGMHNMFGF